MEGASCDRGGRCRRRAGGHWGDAGGTGHWPAGGGHRGSNAGVSSGGGGRSGGGGGQYVAMLQWGVLSSELQLDKHHVVPDAQGQGQWRAAGQKITDLQREAALQQEGLHLWCPQPGPAQLPHYVTWGLSPPLSGLWGPCRCHGRLNKMNLYFRKPSPPARPGPGAAGGCGGQRRVRRDKGVGWSLSSALISSFSQLSWAPRSSLACDYGRGRRHLRPTPS